ncbi:hypothetical protein AWC32_02050 [Mycobacterium xenopi]|nr:hypothetical protein AWC32_02050 [Mycobacterium xenopi]
MSLMLIGWAALLPAGQAPRWWHYVIAAAVIVAFVGSWHGQHVSTVMSRWTPMAWRNRRRQRSRRSTATQGRRRRDNHAESSSDSANSPNQVLQAHIVIHLRPQPHALTTPADRSDQLPWEFITAWLDRYGVRADALTVCSVTRTPPASGLRSDSAALLGGRNTQHHDTWLTYLLRAENNVGALTARQTTMGGPSGSPSDDDAPEPHRAALADTTARRLIAELRERGWLATLSDADELPRFVPPTVSVRRETWTGTEYSDGYRAVYAVQPTALRDVLETLPTLNTKSTWVTATVRARGGQPTTIEAAVGTLTATRPPRHPLAGLDGFHGLHQRIADSLRITGLNDHTVDLPGTEVRPSQLADLTWPTAAAGVPIGFNRARQPVYLGLASPEPVRITVTGTQTFHVGIIARLALSGLPIALYTADPRQWAGLANHAGPQQFLMRPAAPPPEAIIVSDDAIGETPTGAVTVTLRRPQSAQAPSTTIVITQDGRHPDLFYITTAHGRQWLSTRLAQGRSPTSKRG